MSIFRDSKILETTSNSELLQLSDYYPNNVVLAYREDIDSVALSHMPRPIPSELLLHINRPRYVFDFKKLVELFRKEAVAYQVFDNRQDDIPVIFYSPAQINILGYA